MFCPNITATLERKQAKRDIHGKEFFEPPVEIPINLVRLTEAVETTSVRADQTASRGNADEVILNAKILVAHDLVITKGDVITVKGRRVEVSAIHPRVDVLGDDDHQEIDGNIKGQP